MARPRHDANAIPTEERVLAAAEVAFGDRGYRGTRLSDIAAAAGITRPSLLYHFKTKSDLYTAVLGRCVAALNRTFADVMSAPGDFEERLLALMQAFVDFLEQRPAFAPLVLREVLDGDGPMRPVFLEQIGPLLDTVESWISHSGRVPAGVPVRSAVMHLATDALLRSAAGDLRNPLWGEEPGTLLLTRRLLLTPEG